MESIQVDIDFHQVDEIFKAYEKKLGKILKKAKDLEKRSRKKEW